VVPPELRPYLPPPHTGKANLTRALGTGNKREANRLAVPWIADFQAAITGAAPITENPDGHDWISRYRAYHRGQNRFPPDARLFSPHPALALPETQTKPVPFNRIILLWGKPTNAPKKGKQDMGRVWPVRLSSLERNCTGCAQRHPLIIAPIHPWATASWSSSTTSPMRYVHSQGAKRNARADRRDYVIERRAADHSANIGFRKHRFATDSPLERNGFELSVPRCLAAADGMGAFLRR